LIGASLGAAVALQETAGDPRVRAVVSAETFSDLRTIGSERAPFFFTPDTIQKAFKLAAAQGRFDVDAVSPEKAAARITAPVLLVHGAADTGTRLEHSKRVFAASAGPKQLLLVPGAGHNGSLRPEIWDKIEKWIDGTVSRNTGRASRGGSDIRVRPYDPLVGADPGVGPARKD
jgi:dipeptidyl aminopeptidase/acylaminoacyl peptidase